LKDLEKKLQELDEESQKIKQMQLQLEKQMSTIGGDKEEVDARSVYVGNVDYSTTTEELQQFFADCGAINRVTILCDKYTGHPKGYVF